MPKLSAKSFHFKYKLKVKKSDVNISHCYTCYCLCRADYDCTVANRKGGRHGCRFRRGSSQTLFGSTGASTFLSKATTVAAIVFMVTSLGLAYLSSHRTGNSIMTDVKAPIEQPVTPDKSDKPEATPSPQPAEPAQAEGEPQG